MKKIVLLFIVLGSVVYASAQQKGIICNDDNKAFDMGLCHHQFLRGFSEKLDSIIVSYGVKQTYEYNDLWQVSRTAYSIAGYTDTITRDYTYNEDGNMVCMIELGGDNKKYVYNFVDADYLESMYVYKLKNGEWTEHQKVEYFHNDDESWVSSVRSRKNDEGEWVYDEKVECNIVDGNVVTEFLSTWNIHLDEPDWFESRKAEHTYDNNNNHTSIIEYYIIGNAVDGYEWIKDEKEEYVYDQNGNCIGAEEFEYNTEAEMWVSRRFSELHYDSSISMDDIAGLSVYYDEQPWNMSNKLLYAESMANGTAFTTVFYYSGIPTNLSESTDNQVTIWPNPVAAILNVEAENVKTVNIYTMDGRLVLTQNENPHQIGVAHLHGGCYLLKVTMNDGSVCVKKFVK